MGQHKQRHCSARTQRCARRLGSLSVMDSYFRNVASTKIQARCPPYKFYTFSVRLIFKASVSTCSSSSLCYCKKASLSSILSALPLLFPPHPSPAGLLVPLSLALEGVRFVSLTEYQKATPCGSCGISETCSKSYSERPFNSILPRRHLLFWRDRRSG